MYHKWQRDPAGVTGPDLDLATALGLVPVRVDWSLCPSYSSDRGQNEVSVNGLKKTGNMPGRGTGLLH